MHALPFRLASLSLSMLAAATTPAAHAVPRGIGHLNDTGITSCESASGGMGADCSATVQDGNSGRDVTHASDADGHAGFKFVKLAADGSRLPASATQWSCIADAVTGYVWEMKTTDGGLHDALHKFTNLGDGSATDASGFVAAVNAEGLCGRTDWRLPARGELQGIVDYSRTYPGPSIDVDWFPNSDGYSFWTSTVQASNPQGAHWHVNFQDGWDGTLVNTYAFGQVRVVSGSVVERTPRYKVSADGQEVGDSRTGLIWARCSLGQQWDGTTCTGKAVGYKWQEGLKVAADIAARSGQGWRIPNAKEIASIAVDGQADPAVDAHLFPNTPSKLYWSSSPYPGFPLYAWTFYGYDGTVNFENVLELHQVRLVR